MGRELKYKYHVFQQAWNCYLKLVDIDYEAIFTCPVCKDTPAIIYLDGIAMGTTRQLPDLPSRVDEGQTFPIIPLGERLFIANVTLRKMLNQYSEVGLDLSSFESMLINLQISEFKSFLRFSSQPLDSLRVVDPKLPRVNEVIKLVASSETISAVFRFSALTGSQRKIISKLSLGQTVPID